MRIEFKKYVAVCVMSATVATSMFYAPTSVSAVSTEDKNMDATDVLISASLCLNSNDEESDFWPDGATVDSLKPLYNVDNEQVAWYVKLSTGAYAVVNNDVNNPAVIEFGDAPSDEIEAIYENNVNSTVVYNSPSEVYDAKLVKDNVRIRKAKGLRQNFPELKVKDTYLKKIIARYKNRIRKDNRVSLMSVGGYGFIDLANMSSESYVSDSIPFDGTDWAITGDYSYAENHCGATCVTNLALYYAQRGYSNLKQNSSKHDTFKAVYDIVGPGPVMTIAGNAKKYFKNQGYTLDYSSVGNFSGIKSAISNDRPLGILLCNGIIDWHWILCVGYREYSNGGNYMRIVNGWNNTANKFYKINSGSLWISATEYWVK